MTDPRDDGDGSNPPPDGVTADDSETKSETSDPRPTDPQPTDSSTETTDATGSRTSEAAESTDAESSGSTTGSATGRAGGVESVETPGEPRTLDPTVRYEWIVGPLIGTAVMALIVGAVTWAVAHEFLPLGRLESAAAVAVAVFAVFTLYGIVRSILLYRSWRYVVREESLYLTRGVFTKVQTVVPYVRVQHIDTRRSAFERVLGLSTLVVYTAGSRGADVTIPGLEPDTAEDLQSRLERLAIASEDEDAV
ncbi:PH domain-containing protein [Halosimplex sp. TS25]|uniref:PH domain-containing protein n=1 Tax=Halosimplex rarum TaxID=3396619 RepID=UPI0039E9DFB4